jgi:peptidyl serine alpha-galactosyltransferase
MSSFEPNHIKINIQIGQSYLFFHQIWKSGQTGHVTRVASGCDTKHDEEVLQSVFEKEVQQGIPTGTDRFHLHITPDYSNTMVPGKTYKFFNKPCGLLHWMEHKLGMPQTLKEYSDTLFIIMDPDQFIGRPFTSNDFNRPTVVDLTSRKKYWHTAVPKPNPNDILSVQGIDPNDFIVRDGYPMAQMYMFGSNFVDKIKKDLDGIVHAADSKMQQNSAFQHLVSRVKNQSPLHNLTNNDADNYYVAGPPYIALGGDMYRIVAVWAAVVVKVYEACDQEFLSEMFAYSTAAALLDIPHLLGYNFMVSEPGVNIQEGWNDIDTIPKEKICSHAIHNSADPQNVQWHEQYYPYVIHYCQRFYLGPYFFNKYRLPHTFLTCNHPLYLDPTMVDGSIVDMYDSAETPDHTVYSSIPMPVRQRQALLLCSVVGSLNDAATYWKEQNCDATTQNSGSVTAANMEKVYFVPPDKIKQ